MMKVSPLKLIQSGLSRLRRRLMSGSGLREELEALRERIDRLETALHERTSQLEQLVLESKDDTWRRSRRRWIKSGPDTLLTWGKEIRGDSFVLKAASYDAFGQDKAVLEIGPGYGRLLKAMMELDVPFENYLGVDISAENIRSLTEKFPGDKIHFLQADVEKVSLDTTFDVVLSSLTFKHLFPSFQKALSNVGKYVAADGIFLFDLIEGEGRWFEDDGTTYVRCYTSSEISEILACASLEPVAFDEVQHDPEHSRLLVVARKS